MATVTAQQWRMDAAATPEQPTSALAPRIILSFDVEEHYRIEAAASIAVTAAQRAHYAERLVPTTQWLLDCLAKMGAHATFFVVGQIAQHNPALVRAIHDGGHEVASHGWDHQRVLAMTRSAFRDDIRKSKDALEQVIGAPVHGYRAPTFSVMRETAWALDVLVEQGMLYDSSIYPVRHDRYGVPGAPRAPFRARGESHTILELPPATLRLLGLNTPMGGGGYFRLFPMFLTRWALHQARRQCMPPVATLYFHPWEFDPGQAQLPLAPLTRFRTYVGIARSQSRLVCLLRDYRFTRAIDVAKQLDQNWSSLPSFDVATRAMPSQPVVPRKGDAEAVLKT